MLIAIAGSQGSGKSTVIEKLKEAGYETITRKTSRSILSDWCVTLDDVNHDLDLTVRFQDEITKRKWKDELAATASDNIVFTERSHMDLFTYALVALGKNNKYSDWLNKYYNTCYAYSQATNMTYFLKTGCFQVEADGVRGENKHYSDMVDTLMLKYTKAAFETNLIILNECTVSGRVDAILNNR